MDPELAEPYALLGSDISYPKDSDWPIAQQKRAEMAMG